MLSLDKAAFAAALDELCSRDDDLQSVVQRCGVPRRLSRRAGFASLVHIVLEQQVSLASARACFDRLCVLLPAFTARAYLQLEEADLRSAGLSRQKIRYTRLIAEAIEEGRLPLAGLRRENDAQARRRLTAITGVGNWTADVYLMAALGRADLWPIGDLALVRALCDLKGLDGRPTPEQLEALGEPYRPYRSVATQIYWHHYLNPL